MFGLSSNDRTRLDIAAATAATAITKLEAHEQRCTDRYGEIANAMSEMGRRWEADLATRRASHNRLMWMLVSALGGIFMLVFKEMLLRGLGHP